MWMMKSVRWMVFGDRQSRVHGYVTGLVPGLGWTGVLLVHSYAFCNFGEATKTHYWIK